MFFGLPPEEKKKEEEVENAFTLDQGWLVLTSEAMFGNPFPPTRTVHLLTQLEVWLFSSAHLLTDEGVDG